MDHQVTAPSFIFQVIFHNCTEIYRLRLLILSTSLVWETIPHTTCSPLLASDEASCENPTHPAISCGAMNPHKGDKLGSEVTAWELPSRALVHVHRKRAQINGAWYFALLLGTNMCKEKDRSVLGESLLFTEDRAYRDVAFRSLRTLITMTIERSHEEYYENIIMSLRLQNSLLREQVDQKKGVVSCAERVAFCEKILSLRTLLEHTERQYVMLLQQLECTTGSELNTTHSRQQNTPQSSHDKKELMITGIDSIQNKNQGVKNRDPIVCRITPNGARPLSRLAEHVSASENFEDVLEFKKRWLNEELAKMDGQG